MLATKKQIKFLKEHDGMVIVLNIPNTVKQAIHSAVKSQVSRYESSDIDLLSPDDYHITLFYFQDTGSMFKILKAAEAMSEELPSIKVKIGGLMRFSKVTSEGKTALAAQIDAREIQKFRLLFEERLAAVDVDVKDEHGFTPHMTVAYVPQDIDLMLRLPTLSFQVNQFGVWIGDKDRRAYDLNMDKVVRSVQLVVDRYKGGLGSGHHGHSGIPGERGGSLPGTGGATESLEDKRKRMTLSMRTRNLPQKLKEDVEAALLGNDKITTNHIRTIKQISSDYPYADDWPDDIHGVAFKDGRLHFNPNTNVDRNFLMSHEMGHLVHARMSQSAQTTADNAWTVALAGSPSELKAAGIVVTGGEVGITSHYALTNVNEFVAESFRIYTFGSVDEISNLNKYWDGGLADAFDI